MLQEAKDLQNKAVKKLIDCTLIQDKVNFQAPTGSGKTHMMADYMDRIIQKDDKVVFIVSSLSKGDLARQNYEQFLTYKNDGKFINLNPHLINTEEQGESDVYIPSTSNVYVLPRDLYKKNGKLMRGVMLKFLDQMVSGPSIGGQGKKIYLIKDEAHIKTNNLDDLSSAYFSKVINISATLKIKKGEKIDVEITEREAIDAKLIKNIVPGESTDTLRDALRIFKQTKKDYSRVLGIKPCFIIQISNQEKADWEWENQIKPVLDDLEFQDLQWVYIVGKADDCKTNSNIKKLHPSHWKDELKRNDNEVDVIIFKMVITEGWDIPRACMLYQIRDTQSKVLDKQVIGRVRRNPRLRDFEFFAEETQKMIMQAHVWGIQDEQNDISVDLKPGVEKEILIKTTVLEMDNVHRVVDIERFVDEKAMPKVCGDIFALQKSLQTIPPETQEKIYEIINQKTYEEWFKYAEYAEDIKKEYKNVACDYKTHMGLKQMEGHLKLVSFPLFSSYTDNNYHAKIDSWVWQRRDGNCVFSMDSQAEQDFVNQFKGFLDWLDDEQKPLWGKNFIPNSEICFEYYLNGKHSSYPDFIIKDRYGQIHIFEVKSLNTSTKQSVSSEEYETKIAALEECYKQAAVLTGYNFYIPIQKNEQWHVKKMYAINGVLKTETKTLKDVFNSMK